MKDRPKRLPRAERILKGLELAVRDAPGERKSRGKPATEAARAKTEAPR